MTNKNYAGYLIDLDGTIYRGKETIASGRDFVRRLQEKNIPYLFLTNNTTRTRQMVVDKLAKHGVKTDVDHIYTPSMATATFIRQREKRSRVSVDIVGELGLYEALLREGFELDDVAPDYVVVGMDKSLTYEKLKSAVLAVRHGSFFIGTNADKNLPTEEGMTPGAGSIIALVETAVQQRAFYIGKPEKIIVEMALAVLGMQKDQVLIVGDNYETDIMAGINSQVDTLLVYTGVSTREQVAEKAAKPTYELDTLAKWQRL